MLFFPDTHEVLWLEGGHLVRAWMDKTERAQLAQLPGDANETELQSGNGTGPTLRSGNVVDELFPRGHDQNGEAIYTVPVFIQLLSNAIFAKYYSV